jgi:hypothetical protein
MSSLVEELQRDALDGRTDVSTLLRKAYVVATKLGLAEFKSWCDRELNGYDRDLPEYRKGPAVLKAWNPYNGWIPVMMPGDPETARILSTHREWGPIGPIQDLVNQPNPHGYFVETLGPEEQDFLMRGSRLPFQVSRHIGASSLVVILDAVRNIILDWSLKLEAEGIIGQGMSFSKDEKSIAQSHSADLQSVVNNITIQNMNNSSIQQGSPNARHRRIG